MRFSTEAAYIAYNRATLLIHLKEWQRAEADIRTYINRHAFDPKGYEKLSTILGAQDHTAEAMRAHAVRTTLEIESTSV